LSLWGRRRRIGGVGRRGFRGWRFGGGGGRGVRFGIGSLPGRLKGKLLAFLTGCEGEAFDDQGKGKAKGCCLGGFVRVEVGGVHCLHDLFSAGLMFVCNPRARSESFLCAHGLFLVWQG